MSLWGGVVEAKSRMARVSVPAPRETICRGEPVVEARKWLTMVSMAVVRV
jgi:hypothetical protein